MPTWSPWLAPIRIIGAGIGGLTLGRCLGRHRIPFTICNPAPKPPFLLNNYGITLHASSYLPLLPILRIKEDEFRNRVAVDAAVGGHGRIDPQCLVCPGDGNVEPLTSFQAHRGKLEALLRKGLFVHRYALEEVGRRPSGGLTLHMTEGPSLKDNDMIVGADGAHSLVRNSLSPETEPHVLAYVAIRGKRLVKRGLGASAYAQAFRTSTVHESSHDGGVLLRVSLDELSANGNMLISWTYSRPLQNPNNPLDDLERLLFGEPPEFYREIGDLGKLSPPFEDAFQVAKLESDKAFGFLMHSTLVGQQELQSFADKGVVFMGDAAHAEPVPGGEGANNAIKDAIGLADCISRSGKTGVRSWYDSKYPIWESSVRDSHSRIAAMHSSIKVST